MWPRVCSAWPTRSCAESSAPARPRFKAQEAGSAARQAIPHESVPRIPSFPTNGHRAIICKTNFILLLTRRNTEGVKDAKHRVSPNNSTTRCAARLRQREAFWSEVDLLGKSAKTFLWAHEDEGNHAAGFWLDSGCRKERVMVHLKAHTGPSSGSQLEKKSFEFLRQSSQETEADWLPSQPVAQRWFKANNKSITSIKFCLRNKAKSPYSLISNSAIRTRSLSSSPWVF